MNTKQIKIIDCFTELIVYTLEFKENAQSEVYTIEKLKNDYETLIEKAEKSCGLDEIKFHDALFPIVALIDEVILNSQNRDKKLWRRELLQKKFFNTSNAGYEFFDKLENLPHDAYDMRLLYLYCIFLDFKGKYYKTEDEKNLKTLFSEQKRFLRDNFPNNFPKFAFKKAYSQNIMSDKKAFKASYKGVWIVIGISLAVGLVLFLASQSYLNTQLTKYNLF